MLRFDRLSAAILAAFALLASISARADPSPTNVTSFTAEMAKRLQVAAPAARVVIGGPLTLVAKDGPLKDGQINLDRAYAFCATNPADDCESNKTAFIASAADILTYEEKQTADVLITTVRGSDYCDQMARTAKGAEVPQRFLMRPIAEGLCAALMFDYPRSSRWARDIDIAELGMTEDDAWARGARQVLANLPRLSETEGAGTEPVTIADREHIPSLMLDDEEWAKIEKIAGGPLIVTIADERLMVVIPASRTFDIAALREATQRSYDQASRGISTRIYRRNGGGWEVVE